MVAQLVLTDLDLIATDRLSKIDSRLKKKEEERKKNKKKRGRMVMRRTMIMKSRGRQKKKKKKKKNGKQGVKIEDKRVCVG